MEYVSNRKPDKEVIDPKTQSLRKQEELKEVIGVSHTQRTFKQPTMKAGFGEYAPTIDSRHKRLRHYLDSHYIRNPREREQLEKFLRIREEYEYYGLRLGVFFGAVAFFFPGVRRLPFYYRIPITAVTGLLVTRAFRNYGDEVFEQRTFVAIENFERENRIRNYIHLM